MDMRTKEAKLAYNKALHDVLRALKIHQNHPAGLPQDARYKMGYKDAVTTFEVRVEDLIKTVACPNGVN